MGVVLTRMLNRRTLPYVVMLVSTAAALGVLAILQEVDERPQLLPLFVVPVLLASLAGGLWPGLIAAALNVLVVHYFVLLPLHTLDFKSRSEFVTWAVFIGVALLTGSLSGRLRDAQMRARSAEARYRSLFEGIADPVLVGDRQGRYVDANPAASALLGYSRAELRRMWDGELASDPDLRRRLNSDQWQAAAQAGSWRGEAQLRRRNGALVAVEETGSLATMPDGSPVMITTLRDVSERKELERMQRDFLVMVTHDLKSPLTSIRGFADLMRRRGVYNERGVEAIVRQSQQLERLISDLLDAARVDAGQLVLNPGQIDLVALVEVCVEMAQAQTGAHTLRLDAPAGPLLGWWDRGRLEQVLHNLLSNAIKYSPQGGDIVVCVEDRGAEALVAVSDRGVGIPPEALAGLFARFHRVASPLSSSVEGLGLGLFITRSLVEAHGGRVWVESVPGLGSTFSFAIPYAGADAPALERAAFPPPPSATSDRPTP